MLSNLYQYEQPVNAVIELLVQLKVKVTHTTVDATLQNHPDYPSLLSLSDSLNTWNVNNAAFKIAPDQLNTLPVPFLAFIGAGKYVIVNTIQNPIIYYTDTQQGKVVNTPISDFLKIWEGVVLLAEATKQSGEKNYKYNKHKEILRALKIPALLVFVLFISIAAVLSIYDRYATVSFNFFTAYTILLFLKITCTLITSLLLWYQIDKANPTLQKICTAGKKTSCNAILNSKSAKIGGISWSEIGFFYFAGGFLFVVASAIENSDIAIFSTLQIIQLINLLALPYIIFSIYYQWRVAKQWCPLCLTVQAILLLEFVTFISTGTFQHFNLVNSINFSTLSTLLITFTFPIIAWFLLKPLLQGRQKAKQDYHSLKRLKFNAEIFNSLLQKQKQITVTTDGLGITLGNLDATNTLIKVCNPYCGPCAKAHTEIDKLLQENENLKVQIIFTSTANENDHRSHPVKHLMAIAENNVEANTKQALDDWYLAEKKDYRAFSNKYPMNGELKKQELAIEKMKQWCSKIEISFTPTFFFNGSQLPKEYSIDDLQYFLL